MRSLELAGYGPGEREPQHLVMAREADWPDMRRAMCMSEETFAAQSAIALTPAEARQIAAVLGAEYDASLSYYLEAL